MHTEARSQLQPSYPQRSAVPDDKVPWAVEWPTYAPVTYTAEVVVKNDCTQNPKGWADAEDPTVVTLKRISNAGPLQCNADGAPINPVGRTGITGRGLLGRWGPNHAADPIVTRHAPGSGQLQMVAIRRKDTGVWAIPGGMVDPGEAVSATLRREFEEEAGNVPAEEQEVFRAQLDELFASGGKEIYKGYIDDPRNTDNAWMESTAMHFHVNQELGKSLSLHAGDDAADVKWLDVSASNSEYTNLYASHRQLVDSAVTKM